MARCPRLWPSKLKPRDVFVKPDIAGPWSESADLGYQYQCCLVDGAPVSTKKHRQRANANSREFGVGRWTFEKGTISCDNQISASPRARGPRRAAATTSDDRLCSLLGAEVSCCHIAIAIVERIRQGGSSFWVMRARARRCEEPLMDTVWSEGLSPSAGRDSREAGRGSEERRAAAAGYAACAKHQESL